MKLPKNLLTGLATKPDIYLCETDKSRICKLETTNMQGNFKFNSYSELSFDVSRVYNNIVNGQTKINPYYNKIEAVRLVYLSGFGYFELQAPELISNGIEEKKTCTAYSLEYTLSQKYLENFYVNRGTVDSIEVINAKDEKNIVPIVLYDASNKKLSLLHLILEKAYGWKIGHVDKQLQTLSRQFEIDRESIYDFLMNEVCEKFNCYIVFNTINNTINIYAESPTAKFIGDGRTNVFMIGDSESGVIPFSDIITVSIDGYKTTRWTYELVDNIGVLTLEETPPSKSMIEIVGVDSTWETDVFISFDNLAQEVNVNYDADNIKTVLTVTYGDDHDIREVNLGLPYLTDLTYYYTPDWMGEELYKAYTLYLEKSNKYNFDYTNNSKEMLKINDYISYEENRLSLEYSLALSVNSQTVGTYYVRNKNADGSYYYSAVSLPSEYKVDVEYYSNVTTNLQDGADGNVMALYSALKKYFYYYYHKSDKVDEAIEEIRNLADRFAFMENMSISYLADSIAYPGSNEERLTIINSFLDEMWNQIGKTPLEKLYYEPYLEIKTTNMEAGWSNAQNENYGYYYTTVIFLESIDKAIAKRKKTISEYEEQYKALQQANAKISNELIMSNNFTEEQLIRLNAFLREDELHLDDIIETDLDDLSSSFKIKQDAMESGRIELKKLCSPQLQFSMTMANIYALHEFDAIVDQFQLGNIIRVGIRKDYVKQSRLLEVNINFEDYSDFSCEFGELTSLRSQSDIHADLLSQAISAGKSVATNSNYWTRGSDQATAIDLKIQQGLLDAATEIKAIDGNQSVSIDKYGIHLRKKKPGSNDEYEDEQGWIINNQFLYSDDAFKTTKSVFGKYKIPVGKNELGETIYDEKWGLLAEAVIAGYIEGSEIVGSDIVGESTIKIGDMGNDKWAFEVDKDGNVSMLGGAVQFGAGGNSLADTETKLQNQIEDTSGKLIEIKDKVDTISDSKMYRIEIQSSGPTIMNIRNQTATLSCRVYSWDVDITDTLDSSLFNWVRVSNNNDQDIIWNENTNHHGRKTLTITTEDIVNNANFYCEVSLPE